MWTKTLIVILATMLLISGCQFRTEYGPEPLPNIRMSSPPTDSLYVVEDVIETLEKAGMKVEVVAAAKFYDIWQTLAIGLKVGGTTINVAVYPGKPTVTIGENGQTGIAVVDYVAKPHVLIARNIVIVALNDDDAAAERILAPLRQRLVEKERVVVLGKQLAPNRWSAHDRIIGKNGVVGLSNEELVLEFDEKVMKNGQMIISDGTNTERTPQSGMEMSFIGEITSISKDGPKLRVMQVKFLVLPTE